jgi:hypothetical protein
MLEGVEMRGHKASVREVYRREVGYVRSNVHGMDYPR